MARKANCTRKSAAGARIPSRSARPSALLDTRVIYCGDCLDQLRRLPDQCVDLIYIDPPFNSNRSYEVFWGVSSEPRAQASGFPASFEDRHASTEAYIEFMWPRCVELARVLKKTGSLYYCSDCYAPVWFKAGIEELPDGTGLRNEARSSRKCACLNSHQLPAAVFTRWDK